MPARWLGLGGSGFCKTAHDGRTARHSVLLCCLHDVIDAPVQSFCRKGLGPMASRECLCNVGGRHQQGIPFCYRGVADVDHGGQHRSQGKDRFSFLREDFQGSVSVTETCIAGTGLPDEELFATKDGTGNAAGGVLIGAAPSIG